MTHATETVAVFLPGAAEHEVSVFIEGVDAEPLPFAQEGTTFAPQRARAQWRTDDAGLWRLRHVTLRGEASNGTWVTVDYFPDNPTKRPPEWLEDWITDNAPDAIQDKLDELSEQYDNDTAELEGERDVATEMTRDAEKSLDALRTAVRVQHEDDGHRDAFQWCQRPACKGVNERE